MAGPRLPMGLGRAYAHCPVTLTCIVVARRAGEWGEQRDPVDQRGLANQHGPENPAHDAHHGLGYQHALRAAAGDGAGGGGLEGHRAQDAQRGVGVNMVAQLDVGWRIDNKINGEIANTWGISIR